MTVAIRLVCQTHKLQRYYLATPLCPGSLALQIRTFIKQPSSLNHEHSYLHCCSDSSSNHLYIYNKCTVAAWQCLLSCVCIVLYWSHIIAYLNFMYFCVLYQCTVRCGTTVLENIYMSYISFYFIEVEMGLISMRKLSSVYFCFVFFAFCFALHCGSTVVDHYPKYKIVAYATNACNWSWFPNPINKFPFRVLVPFRVSCCHSKMFFLSSADAACTISLWFWKKRLCDNIYYKEHSPDTITTRISTG